MYDALKSALRSKDFSVVEEFELPGRDPVLAPIPDPLQKSPLGEHLKKLVGSAGGLWRHQAEAINAILGGHNVVISTGTASGKSLIFRTAAFHRLFESAENRVAVFYPLKALANDQLKDWRKWAKNLTGDANAVGRIDGSVRMKDREKILTNARVVLMTPDVCHAWLMSNLASPSVKNFVKNLGLIVLDEAHTLEGVFGSNFSFLFRRLNASRAVVWEGASKTPPLQAVATTATILDAPGHLENLTGLKFTEIGPDADGSPEYARRVIHLASPVGEEVSLARTLQVDLLAQRGEGALITFVDSRKGVELLAFSTNTQIRKLMPGKEVLPYRAGLAAEDREAIEGALRDGTLRGVVSTSALELGIDLPHLRVGINIGIPSTRKAFRQRLGRVGRAGPGAFLIVAPALEFSRFGTTLREYYERSVEPSYLYLNNRFMQFAHARCLSEELESLAAKDRSRVPGKSAWPIGFDDIYKVARPGGNRPQEFDAVAMLGGDSPQRSYPLRNVAEINFKVAQGEHADALGEATLPQALRECYPGATYFYMARPYKVQTWRTSGFMPMIRVKAASRVGITKPRIRTWINATLNRNGIVDRHLKRSQDGFLAECEMQITERVQGYEEGGEFRSYTELRERNPNMKPKMRQFRTTGMLLCVSTPWFRERGMKAQLADQLLELFCREYSVLPQDVGSASSNISVKTEEGDVQRSDCIAIFDQTYGSLRLTERLYLDFAVLIDRLMAGARVEHGDEESTWVEFLKKMVAFEPSLAEEESGIPPQATPADAGEGTVRRVYTSGSKLGYRAKGMLLEEVEIITPAVLPDGSFMYQAKFYPRHQPQSPVTRWVNPDFLEPLGDEDEWSYALWDPNTQEFVEKGEE